MKKNWEEDELKEYFSFSFEEREIIKNKAENETKIGFAILFKYFQNESRFPKDRREIPEIVIKYISKEINVKASFLSKYDWDGRSIKRHRAEIRKLFNFSESTLKDLEEVKNWLLSNVIPENNDYDYLSEKVYERLKKLGLEPPTDLQIEKMINSSVYSFEENLYKRMYENIPKEVKENIDKLIKENIENEKEGKIPFKDFKQSPDSIGVEPSQYEIRKLEAIKLLKLPENLTDKISEKNVEKIYKRVNAEDISEIYEHPEYIRYSLLYIFFQVKMKIIIDNLSTILSETIHKLENKAELRVKKVYLKEIKQGRTLNDRELSKKMAKAAINNPEGKVKDVIFSVVSEETLKEYLENLENTDTEYPNKVYKIIQSSYKRHYRQSIPKIIEILDFNSNNDKYKPMIKAINLVKKYAEKGIKYFPKEEEVTIDGVIKPMWKNIVEEVDKKGKKKIKCINYEIGLLESLRDKMRCREIWIKNSIKFKNPDEDIPKNFEEKRKEYYEQLKLETDADKFIEGLKKIQKIALETLDKNMPKNEKVTITNNKGKGYIKLSKLEAQPEPKNLGLLKSEILKRWDIVDLLDILKETDLRLDFTSKFKSLAFHEKFDRKILQKRLILSLYGLATNTGIKRVADGNDDEKHLDLFYVKNKFINKDNLKNAISCVVNAILNSRNTLIWGDATTTCASDSKKFAAWNQNLMTEWHNRYHGRGIMIYWHVENGSVCIHSQIKSCSSSEIAAMIEGILRHNTEMKVEKNYVDTHGQSEVAFAFCHLLGFKLMPRLKGIGKQKLYRPETNMGDAYPNLQDVLTRPINWEIIKQQYDQMVKYATALRLGTAETESVLKRFTDNNLKHPTYQALDELGKVIKTIFLCEYLDSEQTRTEVNEGLNVIENWNSANNFIFYGKGREISTNKIEEQEISALSLHLLQNCLIYINTLMIQNILSEKLWYDKMTKEDFRALTPLIYTHVNPYGKFNLQMDKRIAI